MYCHIQLLLVVVVEEMYLQRVQLLHQMVAIHHLREQHPVVVEGVDQQIILELVRLVLLAVQVAEVVVKEQ